MLLRLIRVEYELLSDCLVFLYSSRHCDDTGAGLNRPISVAELSNAADYSLSWTIFFCLGNGTFICVHTRLTDYVSHLDILYNLTLVDTTYIHKATSWFKKKHHVSEWCVGRPVKRAHLLESICSTCRCLCLSS